MLAAVSGNAQWVQVPNNISGMINSFASINNDIFTGTYIVLNNITINSPGVYRSTNNGVNWTQTSFPNFAGSLHVKGTRLFATSIGGSSSFYSDNSGANWTNMNMQCYSFTSNNTHLYAATGTGLKISTNNGLNWTTINSSVTPIMLVKDNFVLATAGSTLLIVSSNNGLNWSNANGISNAVQSLATNGTEIYAGTYSGGVLKSTDNGFNFTQTSSFNGYQLNSIIADGTNVIAGSSSGGGIFVSTNKGTNWTLKNEGFNGGSASISKLLYANGYIFAGEGSQVWRRNFQNLLPVKNITTEIPSKYSLGQNYPNPFNPTTVISFQLPVVSDVSIKIYDVQGREVQMLVNERMQAGMYEVSFDGSGLTSGVYFYQMRAGKYIETKRMILLK